MQNESQNAIAFVKCGIVDKLMPKPVCQKVVMAGTRTFRIPYQAPHPYLDWAKRHFVNLYFDKYYKAFPEAKLFAQSMGRVTRRSKPVKILYMNTIEDYHIKPLLERKLAVLAKLSKSGKNLNELNF